MVHGDRVQRLDHLLPARNRLQVDVPVDGDPVDGVVEERDEPRHELRGGGPGESGSDAGVWEQLPDEGEGQDPVNPVYYVRLFDELQFDGLIDAGPGL